MATFWLTTLMFIFIAVIFWLWRIDQTAFYLKNPHLFACLGITVVYGIYVFINLGNLHSPQSLFIGEQDQSIYIELAAPTELGYFQFMVGPRDKETFRLSTSEDGHNWHHHHIRTETTFAWDYQLFNVYAKYFRITPTSEQLHLLEIGWRDVFFEQVEILQIDPAGEKLMDEQHLIPEQLVDFMHSAYFDEIFYPRTAYEFIHQMDIFERTHPPLGKVILSWSISIFGMTPFAWRLPGVLAGILMIPFIYGLAKALFKTVFWSLFATVIFVFDFMPFVQTRLATLDTYIAFFTAGMFYFMFRYTQTNLSTSCRKKSFLFLAISGIFTALAIATKWSGFYGALGIFILFVISWIKSGVRTMQSAGDLASFKRHLWHTIGWCTLWFIFFPLVIYILSYIPFYRTGYLLPDYGFFAGVIQNQHDMINFHLTLHDFHPFSSYWWEWLINWRPMFYFANTLPNNISQGISSFGNPIVWWGGLAALSYTGYRAFKRDNTAIFLLIGYLVFLVPWFGFTRTAFIYYYFPSVIFLTLMIAYGIKEADLFERLKINRQKFAYCFALVTIFLFLLFYPVLSGVPIHSSYVETFLRWPFMRDWVLILEYGGMY